MATFHRFLPPNIKEILPPPEFALDEELAERVIDDKMIRDYVTIMFICSVLVGLVLLV